MNVRDLIPWSRNEERLPVARRDERSDPVSTLRSDIDRLFDQAFGSFGLPSFASTPSWPTARYRRPQLRPPPHAGPPRQRPRRLLRLRLVLEQTLSLSLGR